MSSKVSILLEDLVLKRSHQSKVAIPFARDRKRTDYVAFESEGPQHLFCSNESFEREFGTTIDVDPADFVPKFLRASKRAYLPGDSVALILMEILKMSTLNGKVFKDCSVKELVNHLNALRAAQDKDPVTEKAFKNKALFVAAIEELEAEVTAATPQQLENKRENAATATKRLAGLEGLKAAKKEEADAKKANKANKAKTSGTQKVPTTKESKAMAKTKTKTKKAAASAKKAPVPAKKAGEKAHAMGVGAFCRALILKGKSNEEVASAAQVKFGSRTSISCVAWYRNKLKQEGGLS